MKCKVFKRLRLMIVFLMLYVTYNFVSVTTKLMVVRPSVNTEGANDNAQTYTTRKIYGIPEFPVFSVIAVNSSAGKEWDIFAVNAWINQTAAKDVQFCCYLMGGGKIITLRSLRINQRIEMFNLTAQVECPNPSTILKKRSSHSHLVGLTISRTGVCISGNDFVKPYYPLKQTNKFSFAICGKLIYGDINIPLTLEWMEYNRYMGVSKVVLYEYNISSEVSKILKYYQSTGFVDVIPFSLPSYADTVAHRPGMKTVQAWNDEQILVYDCQSRLRGYKYVGVIDMDEFIVPVTDRNFENMLGRLIYVLPNMAAAEVYGEMFILDWKKTNKAGKLIIEQYENRTVSKAPIDINQRKLIHLPSRVQRGSVVTHGCKALNSTYAIFKDPLSVMSINHYRKCVYFRDDCFTRAQVTDKRISRFLKKVEIAVHKTKQILNMPI
ncbi:uncharacterized protein LOC123551414 [Mercenaria mercenaria]|uniref:uncharacterized protein LOC123551414 n=1 Tax=Mercenaria mercenaria TaxID=6596 RepID=UPI00234EB002|nr:uncharacterized protein LOC123551414 [Mercenaria mercenaria]